MKVSGSHKDTSRYLSLPKDIGDKLVFEDDSVEDLSIWAEVVVDGASICKAKVTVHRDWRKNRYEYRVRQCKELVPAGLTYSEFNDNTCVLINKTTEEPSLLYLVNLGNPHVAAAIDQYRRKTAAAAAAGNGRQRGSYLAGQPPLMQGRGTGNSFQMGAAGGFMMPPLMRRPPDQPSCAEAAGGISLQQVAGAGFVSGAGSYGAGGHTGNGVRNQVLQVGLHLPFLSPGAVPTLRLLDIPPRTPGSQLQAGGAAAGYANGMPGSGMPAMAGNTGTPLLRAMAMTGNTGAPLPNHMAMAGNTGAVPVHNALAEALLLQRLRAQAAACAPGGNLAPVGYAVNQVPGGGGTPTGLAGGAAEPGGSGAGGVGGRTDQGEELRELVALQQQLFGETEPPGHLQDVLGAQVPGTANMVLDGVSPGLGGLQGAGVPVSHPNAAAIASALGQGPPDPPAVCGVPVKDGLAPGGGGGSNQHHPQLTPSAAAEVGRQTNILTASQQQLLQAQVGSTPGAAPCPSAPDHAPTTAKPSTASRTPLGGRQALSQQHPHQHAAAAGANRPPVSKSALAAVTAAGGAAVTAAGGAGAAAGPFKRSSKGGSSISKGFLLKPGTNTSKLVLSSGAGPSRELGPAAGAAAGAGPAAAGGRRSSAGLAAALSLSGHSSGTPLASAGELQPYGAGLLGVLPPIPSGDQDAAAEGEDEQLQAPGAGMAAGLLLEINALQRQADSQGDIQLLLALPGIRTAVAQGNVACAQAMLSILQRAGPLSQQGSEDQAAAAMEEGDDQQADQGRTSKSQRTGIHHKSAADAAAAAAAATPAGGATPSGFFRAAGLPNFAGAAPAHREGPATAGQAPGQQQGGGVPDAAGMEEESEGVEEEEALAEAAARAELDLQMQQQHLQLAGEVSQGLVEAYCAHKHVSAAQLAAAKASHERQLQEAWYNDPHNAAAAAEGFVTDKQYRLWIFRQLAMQKQGMLSHVVGMGVFMGDLVLRSYAEVSRNAQVGPILEQLLAAADAEHADHMFKASKLRSPAKSPAGKLVAGGVLTLTLATADMHEQELKPVHQAQQVQLQLVKRLGSGGFGLVWLAKPVVEQQEQLEACQLGLQLAAAAGGGGGGGGAAASAAAEPEVPELVALKMGVTQVSGDGSSATWRLTREASVLEQDAYKEAACMQVMGPCPLTGNLVATGWVSLPVVTGDAAGDPEVTAVPTVVMEVAELKSLWHVLYRPPYRAVNLFPRDEDGHIRAPNAYVKHVGLQLLVGTASHNTVGQIVHRDMKPENTLAAKRRHLMVYMMTDFGLSGEMGGMAVNMPNATAVGTRGYMAPEQRKGHAQDHKADVFAIGIMMLVMLLGYSPLGEQEDDDAEDRGKEAEALAVLLSEDEKLPGISGELRVFLAALCHPIAAQRPTAFQALCMRYMCSP